MTVHNHQWHDISKFPKFIRKDWFAVYYFPETEKKHDRDYVLSANITTEQYMGSRKKTKFMLCKKPEETK